MKIYAGRNWLLPWLVCLVALAQFTACGGSSSTPHTAPAITSAASVTFFEEAAGTFTATTTGDPAPTLALTGALPTGVAFVASTGVLSGTPAAGSHGTYPLTITASNGSPPDATQSFTLTVQAEPSITSANHAMFTEGSAGTFSVTAGGSPAPTLTLIGALPTGVSFHPATGVLSGTPATGSNGTYMLSIAASNGTPIDATQSFTLLVVAPSTTALVVHDGTAGLEASVVANLSSKLTAAGLTPSTHVSVPSGNLSGYAQIWDVRFNSTTPLTPADIASYTNYLEEGRTLVVIGENTGFATRNDTIVSLIAGLGGGTITIATPANAQTVQPPFNAPNTITTVTYQATAGTANPGTGTFITKDASNIGAAIYYPRDSLSSAVFGRLMVVFDINFLDPGAAADLQSLTANMIALP
jgi:large repetitive protein